MIDAELTKKILADRGLYRNDIPAFARRVLKIEPDRQQEKALVAFQDRGRLAVKAGHGVGKTVVMTILLFHFLYCYSDAIVPCTAPTKHQLNDILWTEAARWLADNPLLRYFFRWSPTKIAVRGHETTWYAIAVPSSKPANLAGFHAKNLLYLLDEAPGINDASFAVVEGALTREENKVAMIGNPTRISGYYFDAFGKNRSEWATMTISCEGSTLVSPEYVARMARTFGVNSNIYRVRVLGEFPTGEDDSVISIDLIYQAINRDEAEPEGPIVYTEAGLDVARYGNDRSEFYVRRGLEIVDHVEIEGAPTTDLVARALELTRKWGVDFFKIDETGLGAGVVDQLTEALDRRHDKCQVVGVTANQRAQDDEKFADATAEMYFNLRDVLADGAKIPDDDDLVGELSLRKYKFDRATGRIKVNSKEELRADMKKSGIAPRSPDKGDALALCFYSPERIRSAGAVETVYRKSIVDKSNAGGAEKW